MRQTDIRNTFTVYNGCRKNTLHSLTMAFIFMNKGLGKTITSLVMQKEEKMLGSIMVSSGGDFTLFLSCTNHYLDLYINLYEGRIAHFVSEIIEM